MRRNMDDSVSSRSSKVYTPTISSVGSRSMLPIVINKTNRSSKPGNEGNSDDEVEMKATMRFEKSLKSKEISFDDLNRVRQSK